MYDSLKNKIALVTGATSGIGKGITTFKVNASAPNTKAIEFYKKNGFKEHDITLWCKT